MNGDIFFSHFSDLNKLPCYKYEIIRKDPAENQEEKSKANQSSGKLGNQLTVAGQNSYFTPTVTTLPTVTEDLSEHRLGNINIVVQVLTFFVCIFYFCKFHLIFG